MIPGRHVAEIMRHLGAGSRSQAGVMAAEVGLARRTASLVLTMELAQS